METLAVVAVLVIVIVAPLLALAWYQRRIRRTRAVAPAATPAAPIGWGAVQAGDRIAWDGREHAVRAIVDCVEERRDRLFGWRWVLIEGAGLIEYRSNRLSLFGSPTILDPEGEEHEALTAPRGALARFESRSRLSWEPVTVEWQGRPYEVTGTGTFESRTEDDLSAEPVWGAISSKRADNVYFALEAVEGGDPPPEGEGVLLGIWTDRVALFPCLKLGSTADASIRRPGPDLGAKPS